MTEAEIYTGLTEIFHDLFGDDTPPLRADLAAPDVEGWDSFSHINLIAAVELRFGIEIPTTTMDKLVTVGDIVGAIVAGQRG